MKTKSTGDNAVQLRIRILAGPEIALGPGKVELLRLVQETHSISEAARQMEMSYMRAWSLIQTMNHCFKTPVVETMRGGSKRGGAMLTPIGEKLVALYGQLETECLAAGKKTRSQLVSLLKKKS
jgi:molybdate transport system regulatory protein